MIANMYKKEMKMFLRSPFQIAFMLVAPVVLILMMGYAMSNIVGETAEVETDDAKKSKVLYVVEETAMDADRADFNTFMTFTKSSMGIKWQEVSSFEDSKEMVDSCDAIALIQVSEDGFYYYRSPYNEPTESKLLRAAYQNMLGEFESLSKSSVTSYEVEAKTVDSYTYFTFAELGFIMLYISLIVGQSVFMEKDTKAFRRIFISKANVGAMLISKTALGVTIGIVQILEAYLLSTVALDVKWGDKPWLIALVYLTLAFFSSLLGAMLGLFAKTRAAFSDKVLVISILVGMLGGGLTPLTFLDSIKVVSYLCKMSPLYWIVNGVIALAGNQSTTDHYIGMALCMAFVVLMFIVFKSKKRQESKKGVFLYE